MYEEKFMRYALARAKKAASIGEVPVGAVVVQNGKLISSGYNRRESKKNALMHAEITAIDRACKRLGGWRLCGCDLYVTLEPCPMCAGAIVNARLEHIYVGTRDPKAGAFGSVCDLAQMPLNHKPEVTYGYLKQDCTEILKQFFRTLRNRNR